MIFLVSETLNAEQAGGLIGGAVAGLIGGFLIVALIIALIILIPFYLYFSFAYSAIGKKTGHPSPNIAWIPYIGESLIASRSAKMHWWPLLLLFVNFVIGIFIFFSITLNWGEPISFLIQNYKAISIVSSTLGLIFWLFFSVWMWKTYQIVGKSGWWAIFLGVSFLISYFQNLLGLFNIESGISSLFGLTVFICFILNMVFIGIAAWGNSPK